MSLPDKFYLRAETMVFTHRVNDNYVPVYSERLVELLSEYIKAEHGETVVLKKGYKPELEALVQHLKWAKDYPGEQLLIEPPTDLHT